MPEDKLRPPDPRVLVVDDDVDTRDALALACADEGYEVLSAGTAGEALALAAGGPLAAVLLDVNLPDRSGFEVLDALRKMDAHVGTAVILVTGCGGIGWADRAAALGATDFVTKPLRLDELALRLRLVTRMHRSQDALVRRALERALADAETKYGAIFKHSAEAILVVRGRAIVDANPAAERVFGRPRAALVGATLAGLSPPVQPDGAATETLLDRLRATGRTGLWCARRADGSIMQLEASLQDLELDGPEGHTLVTARDVTQQRALETELQRARRLESIGLLAAGVAHDFNNILTVISGYVDLALSAESSADPARRAFELHEIRKSAERAGTLTRQLLDFGRPGPGAKTAVGLDHLVERCRDLLARLVRDDVRFTVRLDAADAKVHADPSRLEQVLMNLVVNARDAMLGGGEVTIATQKVIVAPHEAAREKLVPGSYVLLSVRDTGAGMSDLVKERVFDPFFTTKAKGEGTGLGLSIVRSIIEECGGRVALDSYPGEGTTVWVYLPVTLAPETQVPTPGPFRKGHELILLAEDDLMVRAVIVAMLETFGHRVIACATGADASAAFAERADEIALVISSYVMSDEKGSELEARLRQRKPDLKMIFITGQAQNSDLRAKSNTAFVEKPITLHAIGAALARLLR